MENDPVAEKYGTVEARNAAIVAKAKDGASMDDLSAEFEMRPKYIREIVEGALHPDEADVLNFPPRDIGVLFVDSETLEPIQFDDLLCYPPKCRNTLKQLLLKLAADL